MIENYQRLAEAERIKFPEGLFDQLNQISGGLKWSMDNPNTLNAVSIVKLVPFLRSNAQVQVVEDGEPDENRHKIKIRVGEEIFTIYGRHEIEKTSASEAVFTPNLESIRNYLNNPGAKVLYVGGNSDRSVKNIFGSNAINLDIQGDTLSSGDVKADAKKTPFANSTFDLVVLRNSTDIIRDPELKKEIYRILKNGGVLFSAVHTTPEYKKGDDQEVDEYRKSTKTDIDRVYLEGEETQFEGLTIPGIHFEEDMTLLRAMK